ncbi:MAG: hypothetical protein GY716_20120 [bacterium]|nr:hypothetical protein [bacterium]
MTRRAMHWLLCLTLLLSAGASSISAGDLDFTADFDLEDCDFSSREGNDYFSLEPGYQVVLEGEEDGETITQQITVLAETRWVVFETWRGSTLAVETRVVEEREWEDGELVEVSRNFFALCEDTEDVFYFGENVDDYEDGEIVDHEGAWVAGEGGALPGLMMPGRFLIGSRYFQEYAPGIALDRGENVAMGVTVDVPLGTFHGCVEVLDSSAMSSDSGDLKVYCPGVGIVADEELELVAINSAFDDDESDDESSDDDEDSESDDDSDSDSNDESDDDSECDDDSDSEDDGDDEATQAAMESMTEQLGRIEDNTESMLWFIKRIRR